MRASGLVDEGEDLGIRIPSAHARSTSGPMTRNGSALAVLGFFLLIMLAPPLAAAAVGLLVR